MVKYPEADLTISKLDEDNKSREHLNEINTYLETNGTLYSETYDNVDRPRRTEKHYFMGTSVVRIMTFNKRADIKIIASGKRVLNRMKATIENILDED